LLRCMSPVLAPNGRVRSSGECLLLGGRADIERPLRHVRAGPRARRARISAPVRSRWHQISSTPAFLHPGGPGRKWKRADWPRFPWSTIPRSTAFREIGAQGQRDTGGWLPVQIFSLFQKIRREDRVKLTARAAAAFNNKHKFVWTDRRGVVELASAPTKPTRSCCGMVGSRRTTCSSAALNSNQQRWDNPTSPRQRLARKVENGGPRRLPARKGPSR
jgi:hypothetical protein